MTEDCQTQILNTTEEITIGGSQEKESQEDNSDPELRWLQKSQQLKAFSLKDYKQLFQDVNLGCLGPDYTTTEISVCVFPPYNQDKKMRRQKLYSNVIREQNKKISRITFLPDAKNPLGSGNKDNMVPRRKALEYARCILRPKVVPLPQQTKTREPEWAQEGPRGHTRLLEDFDISQLATLEALRKRREQEKQTLAHFKVVHTI
ncbi:jhy protein homolog [Salvelinus alpinus]